MNASAEDSDRNLVFISYSHKDERWRNELETHLVPFVRSGSIRSWSDQQIQPGAKWFDEIQSAVSQTSVALMLVTPDFLASDFIHEHELGEFLKAAESKGLRILWIPVRASAYKETPLKDYQSVLPPDQPLAAMQSAARDAAWVKIGEAIKRAVNPR